MTAAEQPRPRDLMMTASDVHIHRARADAAHAAAGRQIERLDQVGQALEAARRTLSSLRTGVHGEQDAVIDVDRTIARAQADLSELATALAGHVAELHREASEPPPTRGHRY